MQSKLTQPKSPLIQHRPLTMFGRIRQRLRNAYQTVVNPPDERTVHRNIYLFELYMGLRPFELIYPPDDEARPRLQLSRRGFACMCVHITILLISFATYLILDPKNIMGISDDLLATKGNEFSGAVHLLSTVLIYWTIFWHRNSQLVTARLERRFNEHLHSIGVDLRPLCRRTARVALTGQAVVWSSLVSLYVHCAIYLQLTIEPQDEPYVLLIFIAMAMPMLYIQLVYVQFGLAVTFQRVRMEEVVNRVMEAVFEWERAEADRIERMGGGQRKSKQLGWW